MSKYCISCGSVLAEGARFCGSCGTFVAAASDSVNTSREEQTSASLPVEELIPAEIGEVKAIPDLPVEDDVEPPVEHGPVYEEQVRRGPNWLLIGGGLAILLVLALYYLIFIRDDLSDNPARTAPVVKQEEKVEEADIKEYYAVADANIRDRATAQGSSIVGKLLRGTAAKGSLIVGEDGTSEWLQLADEKRFVGMVNLSESKPPALAKLLGDRNWTADKPLDILLQPEPSAAVIDRVAAGTVLKLYGLTENDYIEIKLRKGGVGYIEGGARILALATVTAKPITISFNPSTCSFGGEMEALFAKLSAQIEAKRLAVAKAKYPSDEAREAAIQKYETATELRSDFMKLNHSFNGLTVSAIGQHYESQSVYFSDPPEKVTAAFRAAGFKIGKDGMFPPTDLLSSVGTSSSDARAYGKSELSCGV